jgi:hypothetical protein
MLNIQRVSSAAGTVFLLSGRIEPEDTVELQRLIDLEEKGQPIALDLQNLTIFDRAALKFLLACKSEDIRFDNCPEYLRDWIESERG